MRATRGKKGKFYLYEMLFCALPDLAPTRTGKSLLNWLDDLNKPKIDDDSPVRRVARDAYEYHEGNHVMLVQVEIQSGRPDHFLYSSTINAWLPPFERQPLTDTDKQRVLVNVCRFLDSKGVSYEVR